LFGGFDFVWAYTKWWPSLAIYSWILSVIIIIFFWPIKKLGLVLKIVQNYKDENNVKKQISE